MTPDSLRPNAATGVAAYRNGAMTVHAVRVNAGNLTVGEQFVGGSCSTLPGGGLVFATEHGPLRARVGDWIVRNAHGDYYTCRDEQFQATYERIEE
ncbi:hypothetical protein LO763_22510 [Glycomyces sp. A-F 0318]|uniref:hypothetical protein n=1 Tax=Glycomyces amatae TaxID=2881355 RepID=UPI001E51A738|nr:hypothetical protein [Glycomyces amatae]MCD0446392.1 hypothetical protein [Glycomyces amatae]